MYSDIHIRANPLNFLSVFFNMLNDIKNAAFILYTSTFELDYNMQ